MPAMGALVNLTHHFLIAMPSMADPHFAHTLIYICEHNDKGALGIVINKPIDMTLSSLFEQIDVPLGEAGCATRRSTSEARCRPIAASCCTGRSATGSRRSRSATTWASRHRRTFSRPSAHGEGPRRPGVARLRRMVRRASSSRRSRRTRGSPSKPSGVIFDTPPRTRLPAAMQLLGIDFSRLSEDVGHA